MKKYCVTYNYRTHFDTVVRAKNKKDAENKVREVIGNCQIEGTWEVRNASVSKDSENSK